MNLYTSIRPLLFHLDPEVAHNLTLKSIANFPSLIPKYRYNDPVTLMGITFPNRLGLAAGLDKDGIAVRGFDRMGFGLIEVGTVTPRPQPGNDKPRLFRLPEHQAIINRMGFNNHGVDNLVRNVASLRGKLNAKLGINLGKNKDTPNEKALDDYVQGMNAAYAHADYLTINISSPNTQGLRALQHGESLRKLLSGLKSAQTKNATIHGRYVPILVKIAPDMSTTALDQMLVTIVTVQIDGIIATNTTLDKTSVANHRYGNEQGGLSGAPLTEKSDRIVAHIRERLPNIPIIAAGGVMTAEDYLVKRKSGADLVQIYTGLIYRGPRLVKECLSLS